MYEDSVLGELAYRACQFWDAGQAEASANQPVISDLPTLVMSGEFDPVTPPAWGRQAAGTLENSFYFEYPGVGHGASVLEGCPQQMFTAFLQDPGSAPEDACIQEMEK
jgi:pimeloyl-ACP methyl ester carboxylesterase